MKNKTNIAIRLSICVMILSIMLPAPKLNAQACPGLGSITLNVIPAPTPALNGPAQLCAGASGTVGVTSAFNSYAWNVGGTGQSISINNPGTFTVTVTNTAGCTGTANITVTPAPAPVPDITQNPYACNGQVVLNAGSGFATYAWSSGGGSSPTATYTSPGLYTVTVSNAAGCTATDNFNVTIPAAPVVNITGNLTICSGIVTTLSATPGFTSYSWTGGGNSPSLNVTAGGTYTVTATNSFGCTTSSSTVVVENLAPSPMVASGQVCPGGTFGLNVSNGPFVNYSWTGGGSASNILVGAGTYTVTVTAANGCTGTTSASVTNFQAPNPVITAATYACNGQIVLDAGSGYTSYLWTGGATTPGITATASGPYAVTVTNANGCTGTNSFNVNIPAPPVVNISGNASFCTGGNSFLQATSGLANYSWNTGQNGSGITVSNSGTFTVTATDNFGCTTTDNFVVTALISPQPVITGPVSVCAGVNATLSTTTPFTSYNWSTGVSSPAINVSSSGTYFVTVTAANGCTGTDSQVLTVTPAPNPAVFESTYLCNGQITLNAASGFTVYAWSTLSALPAITVSSSGNYTVTVTNAQGCTGSEVYSVTIPTTPFVQISGNNNICPGSTTLLGATPGYSGYQWSVPGSTPAITVNTPGNYTVTVSDAFSCTATASFSVSGLTAPAPVISGPSQICASGSATFSVPGAYASYAWSNGTNGATITVTAANTYAVTVTAANGCTGTDTQILTVSTSLQPQITASPYNCTGQFTLNAGAGFAAYAWSGGQTTSAITVTADDTYTVTVSDAGGCTGSADYAVVIPPAPTVTVSGPATGCAGISSTLTASSGPNTYFWSTGAVGQTINVTTPGTFTVSATDVYGCQATAEFVYNTVNAPQPVITGPSVICTNSSGTLSLSAAYTQYNWSTGATTATLVVATGNTYTVTVTDINGCTGTDSQLVTSASGLLPAITQLPYTCNGAQTLDAGAGYTGYLWSTAAQSGIISVTASGDYTVTVTDGTGCTGTGSITVTIPLAPDVTVSGATSFCQNAGTVLTATAGFATYAWAGGEITNTITANQTGVYRVTVTDSFGCTDVDSLAVTAQPLPQPVITGPSILCAGNQGTLALSQPFAGYDWSDGSTTATTTVTVSGTITVTVTDGNGCTGSDDFTVQVVNNPVVAITEQPYNCDGQITLSATTGFNTYSWSNSGNTASVTVALSSTYTLTITDVNGCSATASQVVNVPALTQVTISGPLQFCENTSTMLSASAGFAGYAWSTTELTPAITVTLAGTYRVTATDALNCTSTAVVTVGNFPSTLPVIAGPQTVCPGNNANLSVTGTYSGYIWSTGETTAGITVTPPFTGTVTVTDANGCTGTATAGVVVSNQLTPVITQAPYNCDGQIVLDAGAGFPLYAWSNGGTNSTTSVTVSGMYTVTVSDGGGCSGTAVTQVTVPVQPQVAITGNNQICPAATTTLSATAGFVTYSWNVPETTANLSVNAAGTYTVTATDGLGCTTTASTVVTALAPPTPVISGPTTICGTTPVTLSVAGTFQAINWSTAVNAPSITVNTPGTYTVTVTDLNGCTGTSSTVLVNGGSITAAITVNPYLCDGQLTLDAGNGFSTYSWSTGGNSAAITVSQSGTYTVTVADTNGCSGTAQLQAVLPVAVIPQINTVSALCPGATSTLTVLNPQNFIQFEWNTGVLLASLTGVQGGQTYTVTVTDSNGCTQSVSAVIGLSGAPVPVITAAPYLCNNQIAIDAGAGFAGYVWNTGATTSGLNVLQSGNYIVTVTNAAGCTGTGNIQVTVPANPLVVIDGPLSFCAGSSTILSASSGFNVYNWSSGATTASLAVNQSGAYTVTVTDINGCTASAAATVTANGLTPALQSNEVICEGVTVTISVVGNYAGYAWPDGSQQNTLSVTVPGIYTVTVTDIAGCTGTASTEVLAVPPAMVDITVNGVLCGTSTVALTASGSVGTFNWSGGASGPSVYITQPGAYTVTITDANGCTATDTANVESGAPVQTTVNWETCRAQEAGTQTFTYTASSGCDSIVTVITAYQPNKPGLTINLGPDLRPKIGEQVSFDVITNFPLDSVVYQSPFALSCNDCFSPSFIASVSGVITVTAYDPDGCAATDDLLVRVSEELEIYVPNIFQPGSQDNGFLAVFSGPGISFVRNFSVFDRWGNALFFRDDMPTNDPSAGWDGTFRNKAMQPGVYVWYFEADLPDGTRKVYKGDVTISD